MDAVPTSSPQKAGYIGLDSGHGIRFAGEASPQCSGGAIYEF